MKKIVLALVVLMFLTLEASKAEIIDFNFKGTPYNAEIQEDTISKEIKFWKGNVMYRMVFYKKSRNIHYIKNDPSTIPLGHVIRFTEWFNSRGKSFSGFSKQGDKSGIEIGGRVLVKWPRKIFFMAYDHDIKKHMAYQYHDEAYGRSQTGSSQSEINNYIDLAKGYYREGLQVKSDIEEMIKLSGLSLNLN